MLVGIGFFQKRSTDGTFNYLDPKACSPKDSDPKRICNFGYASSTGFYEVSAGSIQLRSDLSLSLIYSTFVFFNQHQSSSWEYSFYAPHDTAHLIQLHGGVETFVKRLDHFFDAGYYLAGNEPSFQVSQTCLRSDLIGKLWTKSYQTHTFPTSYLRLLWDITMPMYQQTLSPVFARLCALISTPGSLEFVSDVPSSR